MLAIGGGVLLGVGMADIASIDGAHDGTPWVDVRDAAARAPILTGTGWAGLGVGVALAGIGLGLALGTSDPEEPSVTVALGIGGLAIGGHF